jgi:tetratricopeptide (TPR) repeat protein
MSRFPNRRRQSRPKSNAIIFGFGVGALIAMIFTVAALFLWPSQPVTIAEQPRQDAALSPSPTALPPTATPTASPSPTPSPTPLPTPLPPPLAASVLLNGFSHQWQTWNNCGPSTITTNMSYFGRTETQADAALLLKPNRDDKNVSPSELAAYARGVGMQAIVRQGGSIDMLKAFLYHNLPVLTETWLTHNGDGLGHYRLITGYDDATRQLTTSDSLNGPAFTVDYNQFETDWRVFNRLYLVVYTPEQAETVNAIIGPALDDTVMYEQTLALAQAEAAADPNDAIAHFNQGEALARLQRYNEAAAAFDRAIELGLHWRRLWYQFTPYETYYVLGRYEDLLTLTETTLKDTGGLEEAWYYRGLARQATDQPGAKADFEAALTYNPLFEPARQALSNMSP